MGQRLKYIKLNDILWPFLAVVCGSNFSLVFLVLLSVGPNTHYKRKTLYKTKQELSYLLTLGKKAVLTIWRLPELQICSFLSKDKLHTIQNVQTITGWPTPPTAVTFNILGDFFKAEYLKIHTMKKYFILWPSTHSI